MVNTGITCATKPSEAIMAKIKNIIRLLAAKRAAIKAERLRQLRLKNDPYMDPDNWGAC